MSDDKKAQDAVESRDEARTPASAQKPAGPHAKEHLTDRKKLPVPARCPTTAAGKRTSDPTDDNTKVLARRFISQ